MGLPLANPGKVLCSGTWLQSQNPRGEGEETHLQRSDPNACPPCWTLRMARLEGSTYIVVRRTLTWGIPSSQLLFNITSERDYSLYIQHLRDHGFYTISTSHFIIDGRWRVVQRSILKLTSLQFQGIILHFIIMFNCHKHLALAVPRLGVLVIVVSLPMPCFHLTS